jgi:hypothetical protein
MTDPYDTSRCPATCGCAGCGAPTGGRRRAVTCFLGVLCLDLCPVCETTGRLPEITLHQAIEASRAHDLHLGLCREEVIAAARAHRPAGSHETAPQLSIADEVFYHPRRGQVTPS